jgi:hypothetical protein
MALRDPIRQRAGWVLSFVLAGALGSVGSCGSGGAGNDTGGLGGGATETGGTASTVQNPHLVAYGPNRMLLTWKSGSGMAAQVYDSGTGEPIGDQLTIAVPDHPWQSWKAFPDGSVAWASTASASNTV